MFGKFVDVCTNVHLALCEWEAQSHPLYKISPGVDGHAKLIQYIHEVGYKISEGHGETASWGYEFVWIEETRFGPEIHI